MKTLMQKLRKSVLTVAAAATAAVSLSAPADAQGGPRLQSMVGWEVLGVERVADRMEVDVINVGRGERYGEIRLCVIGGAIRLRDLEVTFGNGRTQDVDTRRRFRPNTCTRAIDLRGRRDRFIDEIAMRYRAANDRGRQPVVVVLGR